MARSRRTELIENEWTRVVVRYATTGILGFGPPPTLDHTRTEIESDEDSVTVYHDPTGTQVLPLSIRFAVQHGRLRFIGVMVFMRPTSTAGTTGDRWEKIPPQVTGKHAQA